MAQILVHFGIWFLHFKKLGRIWLKLCFKNLVDRLGVTKCKKRQMTWTTYPYVQLFLVKNQCPVGLTKYQRLEDWLNSIDCFASHMLNILWDWEHIRQTRKRTTKLHILLNELKSTKRYKSAKKVIEFKETKSMWDLI